MLGPGWTHDPTHELGKMSLGGDSPQENLGQMTFSFVTLYRAVGYSIYLGGPAPTKLPW
jgi:hypothetical protein